MNKVAKLKAFFLNWLTQTLIYLGWRRVIFSFIYKFNIWGSYESRSGDGSTLEYTKQLRLELPEVLKSLEVESILDAPCGDFNWFSVMLSESKLKIKYRGVDIVGNLIRSNKLRFSSAGKIEFEMADLVNYSYGEFDCVLARDFLIHLSYRDTFKFLSNFCESNSKYLITTSYPDTNLNLDIPSGKFREINLFLNPYRLTSERLIRITDFVDPFPARYLYVFSRSEVVSALNMWKA